ncbi:MAG: hypothetical protein N3G79_07120, partial [Sulfolobales archaeon]|nr:hypothetical protein [Sulfolobales archaeon]
DILMLVIGYLLTKYMPTYSWVGTGLIYGAVASLGASGGLMIPGLVGRKEEAPYTIPDTVVVR